MIWKKVLLCREKNTQTLLIVILLLGAFLRVYGLGDESFWLDESETVKSTEYTVPYLIKMSYINLTLLPQYFEVGGLPLYHVLIHYWNKIFGLSEFNLRLFSALFGILSIYLIFLVGKFLFNSQVSLIASFIFAINHQQIYFSQEARLYSMLVALTLLSALSLLHALRTNKNLYWGVFVIATASLLYTHYFTFFILLFQGLFILMYWKKYKAFVKKMIFSGIAIFLLYLPWIPALFKQLSYQPPFTKVASAPILNKLLLVLVQFNSWVSPDLNNRAALRAMNFSELTNSGWILIISVVMIALLLGFAFVFGLICPKGKKLDIGSLKNCKVIFLLLWLLVPIFIPFLISAISPQNSVFSSIRYVLFASPPYYLIASLGISRMYKWKSFFLALLALFSIFPLYSYYINFDMEQWREASHYLQLNRSSNEYLFIQKANNILPLGYYYPDMKNIIGVDNIGEFIPALEGKQSFWLVLSLEKYTDPDGLVKKYADSHYTLEQAREYTGIKIIHYTPSKSILTGTN